MFNTSVGRAVASDGPTAPRETIKRIDEEANRFNKWPDIDLFDRPE